MTKLRKEKIMENKLELTIFAKDGQSNDGRKYTRYITRLVRKSTGEIVTVSVKFRESCGAPNRDKCPMNIIVDKKNSNLQSRDYINKNGEPSIGYTMWISEWAEGSPYEDHSLDDF